MDRDVTALVAAGRLTPHIGLRSAWLHTDQALDALAEAQVAGKAVLTVGATNSRHPRY